MFLWTRRWQFLRANRIVSQSRIFEAQNLKTSVKSFFSGKKLVYPGIISLGTRNAILKNLPKISTKTENLPIKLRNQKNKNKTTRFLKIYTIWRKDSGHEVCMFVSPAEKEFVKSLKNCPQKKSRRDYKYWGCPRRKEIWHSCGKFLPKLPWFYSIVVFSSKSYSAGIDCILERSPEEIHQILKSFPLKVRKKLGFMVLIEALLSSEKSSGHVKHSF